MKFILAILAVFVAISMVPDGRTATESETETLYTSHTCDTGRWDFQTSDADSVTVQCFHPDPPSETEPEN